MEPGLVIKKTVMIPSVTVTHSRSTPIAESGAAQQRLVVVSLQALRDAWVRANPYSQAGMPEIASNIDAENLPATVVGKTQDAYLLRIGNTAIQLDLLGADLKPGTQLRLRVIDGVTASSGDAGVGAGTNDPAQLSDLGRLLSRVIARRGEVQFMAPLSTRPPAANPEADLEFSDALQHSINTSGLFYESHLKDWVNNLRTLADIRQEPQAGADKNAVAPAMSTSAAHFAEIDEIISANTLPVVQHQLETLETQKGIWTTEVWPNQFAQLQIEQEPSAANSAAVTEPVWRASLKMQLPHLGEVELAITLAGDRPTVAVTAAESHAQKSLIDARPMLVDALGGAGFVDAVIGVTHDTQ
jgi:Flagellar hook-length control protein FliK